MGKLFQPKWGKRKEIWDQQETTELSQKMKTKWQMCHLSPLSFNFPKYLFSDQMIKFSVYLPSRNYQRPPRKFTQSFCWSQVENNSFSKCTPLSRSLMMYRSLLPSGTNLHPVLASPEAIQNSFCPSNCTEVLYRMSALLPYPLETDFLTFPYTFFISPPSFRSL